MLWQLFPCGNRRDELSVELAFAASNDRERGHEALELAGQQEERGIAWMPAFALADGERLVKQDAAGHERAHDGREQRPVQVVEDEDRAPPIDAEINAFFLFEVQGSRLDDRPERPGALVERGERVLIPVDRMDFPSTGREEQGMPALPARQIEHRPVARNQVHVRQQPV